MDRLMDIANRRGIVVIEDAAHALLSRYRGQPLGSLGHLATLSFHETKNVISGEGGALLINDPRYIERAEILWEKGTNRSKFFRGQVDKYTWIDVGSSFLPGELTAAFLFAQLEEAERITAARLAIWNRYQDAIAPLTALGVRTPVVPSHCDHNAHLVYVLLPPHAPQADVLKDLNARGVNAVFHYVPLHSSAAGRRFGRTCGDLPQTDSISGRLIRFPLWIGMEQSDVTRIVEMVEQALE